MDSDIEKSSRHGRNDGLEAELFNGKINITGIVSGKNDLDCSCKYPTSNEQYRRALDVLKSIEGIKYYIGICGGGTQNIFLIGELMWKNDIEHVYLVDQKRRQLYNFNELARIYNSSGSDVEYAELLLEHRKRIVGNDSCSTYTVNMTRPKIPRDVTINLEQRLIEDCIKLAERKGRYFVYFSNYLFDWLDDRKSLGLLEKMESDERFEDGSVVVIADLIYEDALVLEKRKGKFVPPKGIVTLPKMYDWIEDLRRLTGPRQSEYNDAPLRKVS